MISLRAAATGELPGFSKCWNGWRFHAGKLCSPEGYEFEPGQILAGIYERQLIEAQRNQIIELEAKLVKMTEAAAAVDLAANDLAIWGQDVRSKAFK